MEIQGKIKEILKLQTGEKKDGSGEWKKQINNLTNNIMINLFKKNNT